MVGTMTDRKKKDLKDYRIDLGDLLQFEEAPWMKLGKCRDLETDVFFADAGDAAASAKVAQAVCSICPVKDECLDYAIRHGCDYGIWGGVTAYARKDLRREFVKGQQKLERERIELDNLATT